MTEREKDRRMKKPKTLEQIIGKSIVRALTALQDESDRPMHTYKAGEINGWKAEALASWVNYKVVRAVRRHLALPKKRPRK